MTDQRVTGLHLRSAGADDEEFCAELRRQWARPYIEALWSWDESDQVDRAAEDFRTGETRILVDQEGSSIGYLRIARETGYVFIEQIALLPEWRHRGVGAALVELVVGEAGALPVRLTSWRATRRSDSTSGSASASSSLIHSGGS